MVFGYRNVQREEEEERDPVEICVVPPPTHNTTPGGTRSLMLPIWTTVPPPVPEGRGTPGLAALTLMHNPPREHPQWAQCVGWGQKALCAACPHNGRGGGRMWGAEISMSIAGQNRGPEVGTAGTPPPSCVPYGCPHWEKGPQGGSGTGIAGLCGDVGWWCCGVVDWWS